MEYPNPYEDGEELDVIEAAARRADDDSKEGKGSDKSPFDSMYTSQVGPDFHNFDTIVGGMVGESFRQVADDLAVKGEKRSIEEKKKNTVVVASMDKIIFQAGYTVKKNGVEWMHWFENQREEFCSEDKSAQFIDDLFDEDFSDNSLMVDGVDVWNHDYEVTPIAPDTTYPADSVVHSGVVAVELATYSSCDNFLVYPWSKSVQAYLGGRSCSFLIDDNVRPEGWVHNDKHQCVYRKDWDTIKKVMPPNTCAIFGYLLDTISSSHQLLKLINIYCDVAKKCHRVFFYRILLNTDCPQSQFQVIEIPDAEPDFNGEYRPLRICRTDGRIYWNNWMSSANLVRHFKDCGFNLHMVALGPHISDHYQAFECLPPVAEYIYKNISLEGKNVDEGKQAPDLKRHSSAVTIVPMIKQDMSLASSAEWMYAARPSNTVLAYGEISWRYGMSPYVSWLKSKAGHFTQANREVIKGADFFPTDVVGLYGFWMPDFDIMTIFDVQLKTYASFSIRQRYVDIICRCFGYKQMNWQMITRESVCPDTSGYILFTPTVSTGHHFYSVYTSEPFAVVSKPQWDSVDHLVDLPSSISDMKKTILCKKTSEGKLAYVCASMQEPLSSVGLHRFLEGSLVTWGTISSSLFDYRAKYSASFIDDLPDTFAKVLGATSLRPLLCASYPSALLNHFQTEKDRLKVLHYRHVLFLSKVIDDYESNLNEMLSLVKSIAVMKKKKRDNKP